ncbi:MAG: hypothetical protein CMM58_02850 [Rhodospirillaceae bacterium]|nr:hypothetical protein [Rhodospirillaceae bacterium]|tara:strand:- start:14 stop:208 length:195 start_codon:yes stop_codon:yes gene_type:complete
MKKDARIQAIDGDGEFVHIEMTDHEGEKTVGVYQLLGWTKPSQKIKQQAELQIYAPIKNPHPVQ